MAKYKFDKKALSEEIKDSIIAQEKNTRKAYIAANKEVRAASVRTWFSKVSPDGANYNSMQKALVYDVGTPYWRGKTLVTHYGSGVSLKKYDPPQSLTRQINKYPNLGDPSTFVINNQWEQGIVALPKYFSHVTINGLRIEVEPYENPYYYWNDTPLLDHTIKSYKYRWARAVNKYLKGE